MIPKVGKFQVAGFHQRMALWRDNGERMLGEQKKIQLRLLGPFIEARGDCNIGLAVFEQPNRGR
jgi:hypothetical protein